jgi:hypothetical protein
MKCPSCGHKIEVDVERLAKLIMEKKDEWDRMPTFEKVKMLEPGPMYFAKAIADNLHEIVKGKR